MDSSTLSVLLISSLCMLIAPSNALICWNNMDFTENTDWNIQLCNRTNNEMACLAQYRVYNEKLLPSFFGCHTPRNHCNECCTPTEGQDNDFSCCCSSDLCNSITTLTPIDGKTEKQDTDRPTEVSTDTTIVIPDLCSEKGCSDHCIEHKGRAECFCKAGYTLDSDGRTCVDIDECAHNNGGCEGTCHNDMGTGYHCSCPHHQMLRGDYHCENFTRPVCYNQQCNGSWCSKREMIYCNPPTENNPVHPHCQATYKLTEDCTYEPRLLSCFSGNFRCEKDGCTLGNTGGKYYYCCCDGNLCNANLTFPEC